MKANSSSYRTGFTLIELILVLVILVTVASISMPYVAGSLRGMKLRTGARTIMRMAQSTRALAIMREETMGLTINADTMEICLGGLEGSADSTISTNAADGKLDQDVLGRLGYTDSEEESPSKTTGIEREIHKKLPTGLHITAFSKDTVEDNDDLPENVHIVRFFPNGQCEWFEMQLEDRRGLGIKLEIDPISGKVFSKLTQ